MGIFRQFPYTNCHDLNLDWVLSQLRGIDEKLDEALDLIENKIADLVNDPAIKEKIDEIIEEYLTPEQINDIMAMVIERLMPLSQPFPDYIPISNAKCKLINDDTNRVIQGSCCDDEYFYTYRSNYYGGAGVIDKYNMNGVKYASTDFISDNEGGASTSPVEHATNEWTFVDSKAIDLGHGNGMYYKADENIIYVAEYTTGSDDNQVPSTMIHKVDPTTLTLIESFNCNHQLMGLGYNTKLELWCGYEIIYGNNNRNSLVFWDKDWNYIETVNIPINSQFRTGMFSNDDYIFLLSTRGSKRGFANKTTDGGGSAIETTLTIYDWNCKFRGVTCMHNATELQSIAWTGKGHVASFYFNRLNGYAPYVSFIQLYPNEPFSYAWYRSNWGKNQTAWWAKSEEEMFGGTGRIPGIDTKVPYSATHLEIGFGQTFSSSPVWITIPRAYDQQSLSQWVTLTLVRSNDVVVQSMRIDQTKYGIDVGAVRTKVINSNGVTDIDQYYKIRQIRAVNYTMQFRYNSYLLLNE